MVKAGTAAGGSAGAGAKGSRWSCWLACGGPSTKTAMGRDTAEVDAGTVRGRNGVVKGIAAHGRMVAEKRLRPHEWANVGTRPGLAVCLLLLRWDL